MKKIYKYKDKEYYSDTQVRQAIWNQEHKVFGSEPTTDKSTFWNSFGVEYTEEIDATTKAPVDNITLQQIHKLKNELQKYDYIGVKIATRCATIEEYASQIDKCQQIRREINALERMLNE